MKVLIIGAAGMIGLRLAKSIAKDGLNGATPALTLFDVVSPAWDETLGGADILTGNISDPQVAKSLIDARPDVIFHLAAIVSGDAEANFDKGWQINAHGTWHLLEEIRKANLASKGAYCPKFINTSSIAVFGGPYPAAIDDDFPPNPETSYGAQKLVGEVLINDYSRKGYLDGIALRLPTIVVRPGKPNKAASSFYSGIIREPLNGEQAILPVGDTSLRHWFASPRSAVGFLRHAAAIDLQSLGARRALNLPGVSCSIADQIAALEAATGAKTTALIKHAPDPVIERIVLNWAQEFTATRATTLGFKAESDFAQIIQIYMDEEL